MTQNTQDPLIKALKRLEDRRERPEDLEILRAAIADNQLQIDPKGSTLIAGDVQVTGGDFVGHDKIVLQLNAEALALLTADSGQRELGDLYGVPRLPPYFQPRTSITRQAREELLSDDPGPVGLVGAARITGMTGAGGIGKSVLAAALARDEAVRRRFPHGIFWLYIGRDPAESDLIACQTAVARPFFASTVKISSVVEGKALLAPMLQGRACLLILDDVWQDAHIRMFDDVLGEDSRLLLTTRNADLLTAFDAAEVPLDVLTPDQAMALLARWLHVRIDALPKDARRFAEACDYLPLALSNAAAQAREGEPWKDLLAALDAAELEHFDHPAAKLLGFIEASVAALPTDKRRRYHELVVFPRGEVIPEAAALALWSYTGGRKESDYRKLVTEFKNRALIRRLEGEYGERLLSLHDLQHDYLRYAHRQATGEEDPVSLHRALVEAYRDRCDPEGWHTGPHDGYFFQRLPHHLERADLLDELRDLQTDARWAAAKQAAA